MTTLALIASEPPCLTPEAAAVLLRIVRRAPADDGTKQVMIKEEQEVSNHDSG
jgi:hypothetical protein